MDNYHAKDTPTGCFGVVGTTICNIIDIPKPTYTLQITPTFRLELTGRIPSKWHQFWMRFLLGWEIAEIVK